jgi:hypothetical protein
MFKRLSAGWLLVKTSARVIENDRSLLVFPMLSVACSVVTLIFFVNQVLFFGVVHGSPVIVVPLVVLAVYAVTFLGIFFNVALAAAADLSLSGEDTSLSDGLDVAWCRLGSIARWALVALAVGFFFSLIESSGGIARWLGRAGQAAWSAATFFVIPVIALEDASASEARQRSTTIVKRCWAEEVSGLLALRMLAGLLLAPVYLVGKLVFAHGAAFTPQKELFVVVAAIAWFATMIGISTMRQVFAVGLYRGNVTDDERERDTSLDAFPILQQ